jgi:hypothetical protein
MRYTNIVLILIAISLAGGCGGPGPPTAVPPATPYTGIWVGSIDKPMVSTVPYRQGSLVLRVADTGAVSGSSRMNWPKPYPAYLGESDGWQLNSGSIDAAGNTNLNFAGMDGTDEDAGPTIHLSFGPIIESVDLPTKTTIEGKGVMNWYGETLPVKSTLALRRR